MPAKKRSKRAPKHKTPTLREKRFIKRTGDSDCKTWKQAAIDAGWSPEFADKRGYEIARRPHVAAAIDKLMDKQNLGDGRFLKTLDEGLRAEKSIVIPGAKGSKATIHTSEDHPTRHKFMVTGLQLRKRLGHGEEPSGAPQGFAAFIAIVQAQERDRGLPPPPGVDPSTVVDGEVAR